MKKKKLNLSELNVKSFVTNVGSQSEETVKGGRPLPTNDLKYCLTDPILCNYNTVQPACPPTYGLCAPSGPNCVSEFDNCLSNVMICLPQV